MLKVIIASRNEVDNTLILKKLYSTKKEFPDVGFLSARPANLVTMLDSSINLLVYNCQHFNSSLRGNIKHWRSLGYLGPIVVLAKVADPKGIDGFADMENVTIVDKPYEHKDLQGIVSKYLQETAVAQRRHRRFETNQTVALESYNKEFTSDTTLMNISKGGAHIVGNLDDISKGDLLRVCFNLDKIQKSRTMSAQVVWTSNGSEDEGQSAGLKFITKSQVYDTLLNGI